MYWTPRDDLNPSFEVPALPLFLSLVLVDSPHMAGCIVPPWGRGSHVVPSPEPYGSKVPRAVGNGSERHWARLGCNTFHAQGTMV